MIPLRSTLVKRLTLGFCLFALIRVQAAPTLGPWVPLFKGIEHVAAVNSSKSTDFQNLMAANALRIDLQDPDIQFLSTPRIASYQANVRETGGMTVSRFVKVNHVQVAINANFFNPQEYYLAEGTPMTVSGLAINRGVLVSPANGASYAAALMIDSANHAKIIPTNWPATSTVGVWTAISGDYPLLISGVNIGRKYLGSGGIVHGVNPRTAVGLSQDGHYLYLLTIDGRQPGYSDGAYDYETAAWLKLLGAYNGLNLDGGGSTTMSMEDSTGNSRRLNRSSAVADSGKERTVGSHLGVLAKPLRGIINDVAVRPDDDAASITWTTDAPATTQVEYGLTEDFGQVNLLQTVPQTQHAIVLTGLQPGTGYYFRAVSLIGGIRYATSNLFFTTTNYFTTNQVVALTAPWKFTSTNLDGVNWTNPSFDDSAWTGPGAGLLWVDVRSTGPNPAVEPKGTELPSDPSTGFPFPAYYFRTHFQLPAIVPGATLLFSGYIDDGAVIYLNGHEVYRLRMEDAPAPILNNTLAIGFPCNGDADCLDEFSVAGELANYLLDGDNVLAVEVHNYNLRSADITFGVTVTDAQRVLVPAVLEIARTIAQTTLTWKRGGFTLQQADSPLGAWVDVPGPVVTSPFNVGASVSTITRYYRLRR